MRKAVQVAILLLGTVAAFELAAFWRHCQNLRSYYREGTRATSPTSPADSWPNTLYMFSDAMPTEHILDTLNANQGLRLVKVGPHEGTAFMKKNCPEYAAAYATVLPLSFKSDIFRLCALLSTGGIYIDDDLRADFNLERQFGHSMGGLLVIQDRPLWNLRPYPFWAQYSNTAVNPNFMVARAPNHPVLRCALDRIKFNTETHWIDDTLPAWHLSITGPSVLGGCISKSSDVGILGKFGTDSESVTGATGQCKEMYPGANRCIFFGTGKPAISHVPIERSTPHYSDYSKIYTSRFYPRRPSF